MSESTNTSERKAPSAGTKVNLGKDAPITKEGPGVVTVDSLAAESQTFRQANEVEPQPVPREKLINPPKPHEADTHEDGSHSSPNESEQGHRHVETAPTYVLSQYIKQKHPHGKNLKEDDSIGTEDTTKNLSFSEFGTENDPGLAAEKKFISKPHVSGIPDASFNAGREKQVDNQQPFGALDRDTSP
ncbi:uncharacterized protein F4812DRAFT_442590 [Daldinia caldariorum]|uniref:uncharacterized protein n=1 Tax=Daldinia caldariorum TaxID=326644 RepID=UPI00200780A3|nr:uncharacterized protein F4812DRAFT_442590 [Daldinia caldariorum]KAI1464541.1 hypothetical protein F4812DRAFT_442590 [Daldinia caldariorum]